MRQISSAARSSRFFAQGCFALLFCALSLSGCGGSTQQESGPSAPAAQTITFASIPAQTAGTKLTLAATASSGLPVSYAATAASAIICSVSGSTVTLIAAGTCGIQASQPGDASYMAAAPVSQSFSVYAGLHTCATPAPANPKGGGGTWQQIQIDPAVYGKASTAGLSVFAFSQYADTLGPGDPQVFEMMPKIVTRDWQRWDTGGTAPADYNFGYPAQAEADGIEFMGGTTSTVLFQDEFPAISDFYSVVSCNAQGQAVVHAPLNFYRGSMASSKYRQYIIGIGEIQIDGGVDGLFFDEPDESYEGATYGDGNEGFDDANVADFGGFLCAKYPNLTAAQWQSQFSVAASDNLNCSASADVRGRTFNYRAYLARNSFQTDPLNPANPLAAEWGTILGGHPEPENGTFTGTYTSLVYWQEIVLALRNYARQKYGKEIYITANGVFPFTDFQANGLWGGNPDGPGGSSANYCPLTASGDLDGTQSLMPAFLAIERRSARIDGRTVLVSAFIDWPTDVMTNYLSLPNPEKQDYWRMYVPEGMAVGLRFSMHLLDTIGDPTATQLGLMPLFDQTSAFYKAPAHAALYENAQNISGTVTTSVPHIATNLTQLGDGRTVAHLINHNYAKGFETQSSIAVSFPVSTAPTTVTLVSPDASADTAVPFTYSNGLVKVTVPQLVAYVAVVAQ
jgi:hypothetical protein